MPRGLVAAAFALSAAVAAGPVRAGDPDLVFFTIETEHFHVHYAEGLERTARLAASLLEEAHDEVSILFGWEPDGGIEVVITDSTDSANGSAMASPRPLIRLYATAPTMDSALSHHDRWLRTLITHEYTHVVHLQMHDGLARAVNTVFGDLYLPNQMLPRWFIEGLAVIDETYQTTAGRIRSSIFRMTVRTHALEGTLLTLGELSNGTRQFPRGNDDYIYGALFMDYLRTRFGMEKLAEICHRYGAEPIPYGLNRIVRDVLGSDLGTLYDDWTAAVAAEAEATRRRVEADGPDPSRPLTSDGESKGQPVFAPDGRAVVLAASNGLERSGIFRVPLDGGERERLVLSGVSSGLSYDRNGRLFYTRSAPFKNTYSYSDVFVLDAPGAEPRRLTHGARAREAAISPDGRRLAMVLNAAGSTRLVIADDRGVVERTLYAPADPDDQVFSPSWSPDGKTLAVVVRQGPNVDVATIDVETGRLELLTNDRAMDNDPVFDPSGRFVVFASDRGGIENIHAFDRETGRIARLTNVATGASAPAVSPDGKTLAFLHYSTAGYDVRVAPFDPGSAWPAAPPPDSPGEPRPDPAPSRAETASYNPLPSLVPRYWMLETVTGTGGETVIQAVTAASDAVGRHSAGVEVGYGFATEAVSTRLAYAYNGMGPGLHLGFSRAMAVKDTGYEIGGEERTWVQETLMGQARLSAPVLGPDRSHSLALGYSVIHARPRDEPEIPLLPEDERPTVPRQYFRAGLSLDWSMDDTVSSPFGVSPESGRRLAASVDVYHPALGGSQTLAAFRYAWAEYLLAPWLSHHVFALRIGGAIYVSDPPEQASLSAGGYAEQNIIDQILAASSAGLPTLRGYPAGAFQGDQVHTLRLEYRFPIWFPEAAYETLPLFLSSLHAGVFTDHALVSYDELSTDDWKAAVGAEIVWGIAIGYYLPISIRMGYARGLMEGGIDEIIFLAGSSF